MFDSRISIFMGMFGSGKTEISLNVALELKEKYEHVALADIDVISPYFRSRDYFKELERMGIKLIAPHSSLMHADLPIITAAVYGYISNEKYSLIIDVGGNDDGAIVLSSLKVALKGKDVRTYFVLNPYRPFTDTVEKTIDHIHRLSRVSRRKIDYLINNSNLGNETTLENIQYGEAFVSEVSRQTNIPVLATVVMNGLHFNSEKFSVFRIKKFLKTPWEG
ncbi:cobalamin biosynthesis protein CobQ [Kosmotoga arenicorallina S304]|uniref:Cobalamin biosynthesis protein CobQ n=1 Tax=Kosmotoga arenicorallina S304 TaxID=1453497 RepID=A0A176K3J0_9BACT|nr:cobalamin biosynthesis protein CobQ [Kosmotoga arenicorallina]OAA31885.1 cobalamin biosynthesis protein CobQ [Kosmotoga arenicorallina S304]